jgi:hypothetical protein
MGGLTHYNSDANCLFTTYESDLLKRKNREIKLKPDHKNKKPRHVAGKWWN